MREGGGRGGVYEGVVQGHRQTVQSTPVEESGLIHVQCSTSDS